MHNAAKFLLFFLRNFFANTTVCSISILGRTHCFVLCNLSTVYKYVYRRRLMLIIIAVEAVDVIFIAVRFYSYNNNIEDGSFALQVL